MLSPPPAAALEKRHTADCLVVSSQFAELRAATRALVRAAPTDGVRLGVLAGDAREATGALGEWVSALGLNRGMLTGADVDGVPVEVAGPIFVK